MKLSLIYLTARRSDGPMYGLPDTHLLKPTLESLECQTFKDFELILVDTLWETRDLLAEAHALGKWSFPIKITHPTPWWGKGNGWSKQSSANNGIRASSGEWVLQLDDCCEIPHDMLERAMSQTHRGSPHLLCCYKIGGFLTAQDPEKPMLGQPNMPMLKKTEFQSVEQARAVGAWNDDNFVRDSRWKQAEAHGGSAYLSWASGYAYGFYRRTSLYHVNGYDERFDGSKPLGDVEIGSRLEMCGLWDGFVDTSLFIYENQHCSPESIKGEGITSEWSNYDLLYWMRINRVWRANASIIPAADMQRICNCDITGVDRPDVRHTFDNSDPAWPKQRMWMERQKLTPL